MTRGLFKIFIVGLMLAASPGPAPANDDSPFGVLEFLNWNHSWNNFKYPDRGSLERVVRLMKQAGVSWVRMDFGWQDMEPQKGQWRFGPTDDIVGLLSRHGIRVLGVLSYSTSWSGPRWNGPPYDDADFVEYAGMVIRHFKGKVGTWEIWNEPDETTYWAPQDDMARYTALLIKVYERAKEENPDCRILNGGLSRNIAYSLKSIYRHGGGQSFDIVAIHPFVNPLDAADRQRVLAIYKTCRKVMEANGDGGKKIWITEIGCPGVRKPTTANGWWCGLSPTEPQQADWVKTVYADLLPRMPHCEKVFWAFFRDTKDHWKNGVDAFGLVRWDYSKKPSFVTYRGLARQRGRGLGFRP